MNNTWIDHQKEDKFIKKIKWNCEKENYQRFSALMDTAIKYKYDIVYFFSKSLEKNLFFACSKAKTICNEIYKELEALLMQEYKRAFSVLDYSNSSDNNFISMVYCSSLVLERQDDARIIAINLNNEKDIGDVYQVFERCFSLISIIPNKRACYILHLSIAYYLTDDEKMSQALCPFIEEIDIKDTDYCLYDIIKDAVETGRYCYLYSIIKRQKNLSFSNIGIDRCEILNSAQRLNEIISWSQCIEKLILRMAESPIAGLKEWWGVLHQIIIESTISDIEKSWLRVYSLCRFVSEDTDMAIQYIEEFSEMGELADVSPEMEIPWEGKIRKHEQKAFECLLDKRNSILLDFINLLGYWNAYKLKKGELLPKYRRDNLYDYFEQTNSLVKQLGTTDAIFVYLNTHLRCALNISAFCSILYGGLLYTDNDYQREIEKDWKKYPIYGIIKKNQNEIYSVHPTSFLTESGLDYAEGRPTNEKYSSAVNKKYIKRFKIRFLDVQHFKPILQEYVKPQDVSDNVLLILKQVSSSGCYSNGNMQEMRTLLLHGFIDQSKNICTAIAIIDCCVNLANNKWDSVSFLSSLFEMPCETFRYFKYSVLEKKYSREHYGRLDEKDLKHVLEMWRMLLNNDVSAHDLLFIYFNTIFRVAVALNYIVYKKTSDTQRIINLRELFGIGNIWMSGYVDDVNHDNTCVRVIPIGVYTGSKRYRNNYIFKGHIDSTSNERCNCLFSISEYDPTKNEFIIDRLLPRARSYIANPKKFFFDAIIVSGTKNDLNQEQRKHLRMTVTNWSDDEIPILSTIINKALSIRFDIDNQELAYSYLKMIHNGNPWALDSKPVTKYLFILNSAEFMSVSKPLYSRLLSNLLKNKEYTHYLLYIYFNSPLKIFKPLDELFNDYSLLGDINAELTPWVNYFDLYMTIDNHDSVYEPLNFICSNAIIESRAKVDQIIQVRVKEFDVENCRIVFQ